MTEQKNGMKLINTLRTYLFSHLILLIMASCHPGSNHHTNTSSYNAKTIEHIFKMPIRSTGEGQPLLLVGGGLTGWSRWEPFVDTFTAM